MVDKKNSNEKADKNSEEKSFEEKEREITERFNKTLSSLSLMF